MHKRFWIICLVMGLGLLVLSVLGLSSLGMHEKGLRAERQHDFINVAEQVRFDIKKKLDAFMLAEQSRPYTDYQYYYVPVASNDATALVRSPLATSFSNGLAYGYFQLDSTSQITNPYAAVPEQASVPVKDYLDNITQNLLPSLVNGESLQARRIKPSEPEKEYDFTDKFSFRSSSTRSRSVEQEVAFALAEPVTDVELKQVKAISSPVQGKKVASKSKADTGRRSRYPISLDESQQTTQVVNYSRDNVDLNEYNTRLQSAQSQGGGRQTRQDRDASVQYLKEQQEEIQSYAVSSQQTAVGQRQMGRQVMDQQQQFGSEAEEVLDISGPPDVGQSQTEDFIQARIEPFVPMIVPEADGTDSLFAGQVFLLRHIQIEDKHMLQGFRLDETHLLSQITESVQKFVHGNRGIGYNISKAERPDAAYTAVLDFGFGEVVLNLLEQQPGWIRARVVQIRNWFFAILAVVWLAVTIALVTFWRNMYEQVQLSRKKDDFISAVSHELRTPLTSIRMYTEMLEKDWVKTEDKRKEYYVTMRQESERLSRLIENVLDFSRIQRGKKRYEFTAGDVNECIAEIVQMMRPYAERADFELIQELGQLEPFTFDRDAVVQIVINLVDNALKYANGAKDRRIVVRTKKQRDYAVIEVEDHGPGIARSQQKKIFEAFYRCGDESTRQATGTGLGLALVKRFAEAHHGFVEIINAKPTGALFRVGLANHFGK